MNLALLDGDTINRAEFITGLITTGAPLINIGTERVVGAVSFDFFTPQVSINEMEKKYSEAILELAREISDVWTHIMTVSVFAAKN